MMNENIRELRSLIAAVKESPGTGGRYCFILGAGASKESGIKTGSELAAEWLKELKRVDSKGTRDWLKENNIDESAPGTFYPQIYKKRFELSPPSGYIRLQKEMEHAVPSCGYYHLAALLAGTDNNLVITTNFDSMTEDAVFMYTSKRALVITHEKLAEHISNWSDRPIVVKVHRDLLLQPKTSAGEVDGLATEWEEPLKKLFSGDRPYVPIVIGYGGNDGSLMGFLERIASKDKRVFWCCRPKDWPAEGGRVARLLEMYNGFLVKIEGFDRAMFEFGMEFGHEFLEESVRKWVDVRIKKYTDAAEGLKAEIAGETFPEDSYEENNNAESRLESYKSEAAAAKENIGTDIDDECMTSDEIVEKKADEFFKRGENYYNHDEVKKAIWEFSIAIALNPKAGDYYCGRGDCYSELDEHEKAIKDYSKAIELDTKNDIYYIFRGNCNNNRGEYEKAIEDYSIGIALDPKNDTYYICRGHCNYSRGEYKKAIEDFSESIRIFPMRASYYWYRGDCYYKLKLYKDAAADYAKAVELDPENIRYMENLAQVEKILKFLPEAP